MLKTMPTWKKIVFAVLLAAVVIAAIIFVRSRSTSRYDELVVGSWQLVATTSLVDDPIDYADPSFTADIVLNSDHSGHINYGDDHYDFDWSFSQRMDDGSYGYILKYADGRIIGTILISGTSAEFSSYRGMLGVNVADDTMLIFTRDTSGEQGKSV